MLSILKRFTLNPFTEDFSRVISKLMEAHPIPQNVTSFQFKLIGDMTLKQFLYLATGLGLAYINFVFLAPTAPFLAWPMITIFGLLGIAFAFLPVGDRPLDYWLKAYLHAVYSPTKRVWAKEKITFDKNPIFKARLNMFLTGQGMEIPIKTQPMPAPAPTPTPTKLPSPEELSETVRLARQAQNLQQQIIQTERDLSQIKQASESPGVNMNAYSERLNALLSNLQRLVKETTDIKSQLDKQRGSGDHKPEKFAPINIEVVSPTPRPKVQLILTSLPNVINGITIDSEGNYLSDVVVVVRDKDGLPVRALKTNKLGQFMGATPLPNGTYTVELEKESFVFDLLKIELDGKVLPAISIAAKKIVGSS